MIFWYTAGSHTLGLYAKKDLIYWVAIVPVLFNCMSKELPDPPCLNNEGKKSLLPW